LIGYGPASSGSPEEKPLWIPTLLSLNPPCVSTVSASINRHRQLICNLSMVLFGHPNSSLAGMASYMNQNNLRLYIAESNSVLPDFLRQNLKPHLFVCSEYFGLAHKSGDIVNGILHEDLQQTSFHDESFDIVLTSEVLEHIPNALAAEKEIMRLLKPGGVYCFTVPFAPASEHDIILARMDESWQIRYLAEPQFHLDRLRPEEVPVYRIFSYNDLKKRFEAMGSEFISYRFWSKLLGMATVVGLIRSERSMASNKQNELICSRTGFRSRNPIMPDRLVNQQNRFVRKKR
jgi:SAM-dependent methyltransferase